MTKIPRDLKSDRVVKAILKLDYFKKEGSKHIIIHDGNQILTTVPRGSKPIRVGTLKGIIEDLGISLEEFLDLL